MDQHSYLFLLLFNAFFSALFPFYKISFLLCINFHLLHLSASVCFFFIYNLNGYAPFTQLHKRYSKSYFHNFLDDQPSFMNPYFAVHFPPARHPKRVPNLVAQTPIFMQPFWKPPILYCLSAYKYRYLADIVCRLGQLKIWHFHGQPHSSTTIFGKSRLIIPSFP